MFRYGLKLWSVNEQYVKDAIALHEQGRYDYIELFVVPDSFDSYISIWEQLDIPFMLHAPHSLSGLNPACREQERQNLRLADEAFRFADRLAAERVIFHPGVEGDLAETIRQFRMMADSRIVVENKPYVGIGNVICNGTTPDEIRYVMEHTQVGFCLDFGHAICSANARGVAPQEYIEGFSRLAPELYHLSDGKLGGVQDEHQHFGQGTYDIAALLADIPDESRITVETDKDFQDRLDDFEQDIAYLNKLVHNAGVRI